MASRFRKLDLNTADHTELLGLPGVGPALAHRIIAARPFSRLADLKGVKGIGGKLYDGLRQYVRVSRPPRPPAQARPLLKPEAAVPQTAGAPTASADDDKTLAPASPDAAQGVVSPRPTAAPEAQPGAGRGLAVASAGAGVRGRPPTASGQTAWPTEHTQPGPLPLAPAAETAARRPRTSPTARADGLSLPLSRRRDLPWIFWSVGLVVLSLIVFSVVILARYARTQTAASAPAAQIVETTGRATAPAASASLPAVTARAILPAAAATESPQPTATPPPLPATPTAAPAAATAVTPARQPDVTFNTGRILWSENFDPPAFNWGRGRTAIADAGYVEGALQAVLQTRAEPYWSIGPTYRVSAANFYYEGDIIVKECAKGDQYGLVFRNDGYDYYAFTITCDGYFWLIRRLDDRYDLLKVASSPFVPTGPGAYRLGVLVQGKRIVLSVNGQAIYDHTENRLDQIPAGSFGVYARAVSTGLLTIRWDNLTASEVLP